MPMHSSSASLTSRRSESQRAGGPPRSVSSPLRLPDAHIYPRQASIGTKRLHVAGRFDLITRFFLIIRPSSQPLKTGADQGTREERRVGRGAVPDFHHHHFHPPPRGS